MNIKRISIFFFLITIIFLNGCGFDEIIPEVMAPAETGWDKITNSLYINEWEFEYDDSTETIHIYRVYPASYNISLVNSSVNPKYISEWAEELPEANIIINGAYFHEDYSPSGYLKIDYNRIGERIFDQNQSGLLQIDDKGLKIRDLSVNPLEEGEELEFGLQSYPFLVSDFVRAIREDSGKVARRTAIGIDKHGYVYLILVDLSRISLYELMVQLFKMNIEFEYVLNLDGGTSTGISIKIDGYEEMRDSLVKVPSIVVFTQK